MMLALGVMSGAEAATVTGYLVDNYCWDKPNHRGIDGAYLGTAPETHVLHCLLVSFCKASGFAFLEKQSDGTYDRSYRLDGGGNAMAVKLFEDEIAKNGDRLFDEQLTATGTLSGSTMTVTSLQLSSQVAPTPKPPTPQPPTPKPPTAKPPTAKPPTAAAPTAKPPTTATGMMVCGAPCTQWDDYCDATYSQACSNTGLPPPQGSSGSTLIRTICPDACGKAPTPASESGATLATPAFGALSLALLAFV